MMEEEMPHDRQWETVVGLEIHLQLKTKTKMFCRCPAKAGEAPNTLVCPICMAHPGTLPSLNKQAIICAVAVAAALNCQIHERSGFDRKHYFYPDLPKGYQITQNAHPIATKGYLLTEPVDSPPFRINIHQVHLEEDAGKTFSIPGQQKRLVDLNRAGIPLVEIVTDPDFRTTQDVIAFLKHLKQLMIYIGASECSMEKGSLRCDANISVRQYGQLELGTRTEVKNLNSFRHIAQAIKVERERHIQLLQENKKIELETRLWDAEKLETRTMRTKEDARDYRFFKEPDLPDLLLSKAQQNTITTHLPEFPQNRRNRLHTQYKIPHALAESLCHTISLADYYEDVIKNTKGASPLTAAHWVMTEIKGHMNTKSTKIDDIKIKPKQLAQLVDSIHLGEVSGPSAKKVFAKMAETGQDYKETCNILDIKTMIKSTKELNEWVLTVIKNHQDEVKRYRNGKKNLISFFIGQVMKLSRGQAAPHDAEQALHHALAQKD